MGLMVLGAAWGRTGSLSVKVALERLGLGPCYHMIEVFRVHPEHKGTWIEAARAVPINWDQLFADYRSAVDWPACAFWPELVEHFPDARVVLVTREADQWYESFDATIRRGIPTEQPPSDDLTATMMYEVIFRRSFREAQTRADLMSRYEQHLREVRKGVDPTRLLEWSLSDGWAPLCEFLQVAEPNEPFPHVNDRDDFRRIFLEGGDPT